MMLAAAIAAAYLPEAALPRFVVPLALGIGSGAAMIPFTMIKEANPPQVKGTAAGVMNFLVFMTHFGQVRVACHRGTIVGAVSIDIPELSSVIPFSYATTPR
jgi:hypothetical protein